MASKQACCHSRVAAALAPACCLRETSAAQCLLLWLLLLHSQQLQPPLLDSQVREQRRLPQHSTHTALSQQAGHQPQQHQPLLLLLPAKVQPVLPLLSLLLPLLVVSHHPCKTIHTCCRS